MELPMPVTTAEFMDDLPYYALSEVMNAGFDTLSIVVWIMCEEARASFASKFPAECVKGNQTPWVALAKLRLCMSKYFRPEDGSAVRKERLEPAAIASAARAASTYWSERYGDLA